MLQYMAWPLLTPHGHPPCLTPRPAGDGPHISSVTPDDVPLLAPTLALPVGCDEGQRYAGCPQHPHRVSQQGLHLSLVPTMPLGAQLIEAVSEVPLLVPSLSGRHFPQVPQQDPASTWLCSYCLIAVDAI